MRLDIGELLLCSCVFLFSLMICMAFAHPEKEKGAYTIWQGDSLLAVGHRARNYQQQGQWIIYIDLEGKSHKIPLSSIYEIDINTIKD